MARPVYKAEVGDILYRSFEPKNPMKVLAVKPLTREQVLRGWPGIHRDPPQRQEETIEMYRHWHAELTLKTIKGETVTEQCTVFNYFEDLVLETEKKAKNHRDRFNQVKAL